MLYHYSGRVGVVVDHAEICRKSVESNGACCNSMIDGACCNCA
jgi:hypothetical protein